MSSAASSSSAAAAPAAAAPGGQDKEAKTSKRPGLTAFKQQRLKAWQPILTPKTVLPTFFVVGLLFMPLGIGFLITSDRVNEITLDYTGCADGGTPPAPIDNWAYNSANKRCTLTFSLPTTFTSPVYMYYRLTNFYQNHRRYVKSFSATQLQGQAVSQSGLSTDCDPLVTATDGNNITKPIYPCGLIANSVFNDTLFDPIYVAGGELADGTQLNFDESNIAWPSDKTKFAKTAYTPANVVPPPNWASYAGTYNITGIPDISQDEHLMVWMRTAGLPTFRKLYARLETDMPKGTYTMDVTTVFPVTSYSGTKSVVLSTTSWLGGKNPFLGIAYIVVGCTCLVLGLAFLVRHVLKPRKLGDTSLLSWNRT